MVAGDRKWANATAKTAVELAQWSARAAGCGWDRGWDRVRISQINSDDGLYSATVIEPCADHHQYEVKILARGIATGEVRPSKATTKKRRPSSKAWKRSPTFVAKFADGVVTRMSCHCSPDQLDLQRGIKLSEAAYTSRTRKSPPAIAESRFVEPFTDNTIKAYDAAEGEKQ
jgi:hypothetical protein